MYEYDYSSSISTSDLFAFSGTTMLISAAIGILIIVAMWKIFTKAGKPGWASIVPIYNIIVMLEIAGLPTWYILLCLIPFANIYVTFKMYIEIAHKFGKSTGFGVGMVLLSVIFIPMLGFSDATYQN